MGDYTLTGVHEINKWLWDKLQALSVNDVQAFAAYGPSKISAVPIIPSQQQPELNDILGGAPYLVYNYTINPYSEEFWMCRETCAYVIYDNNEERLRAIFHYMVDLFKRADWTARDINAFLPTDSPWDFKSVGVSTSTGPDKFADEGGKQSAMVVINYTYTHDLNGAEGNGLRV